MMYPPSILLAIVAGFGFVSLGMTTVGVTPSPDIPTWTIKDDNDNICMLMTLNATLTIGLVNGSVVDIPVPQSAIAKPVSGSCGSNSALFTLNWPGGLSYPKHNIQFMFKVHDSTYKLEEVNGTEYMSLFMSSSWGLTSSAFPSATIGNSMTCHDFQVGQLTFHYYKFQPFAQQSGKVFGKGEECYFGIGLAIVIGLVVALLIFVAVVIAGVVIFVRRMKKRRAYSQV